MVVTDRASLRGPEEELLELLKLRRLDAAEQRDSAALIQEVWRLRPVSAPPAALRRLGGDEASVVPDAAARSANAARRIGLLQRGEDHRRQRALYALARQSSSLRAGPAGAELAPAGVPALLEQLGAKVDAVERRVADELARIAQGQAQIVARLDALAAARP